MKRIDTINVREDLFGGGKHGFHDNADLPGQDATYLSPDWLNHLQEELCNILELNGVVLNPNFKNQLANLLITKNQLVNDLTTGGASKALSAEQGKLLFNMFMGVHSSSGHQPIPNPLNPSRPLLLQWFTGTIPSGSSSANFNYPIAFTTACFQIFASDAGFGAKSYGATPISTIQATLYSSQSSGSSSFRAWAIGY